MAVFMLSENQTIHIQATEISHNDGYVVAWYDEDVVAMFRASEIIGCWLDKERSIKDGRVCIETT